MQITQEKKEQTQRGKGALFAKESLKNTNIHIDLQRNHHHTHPTYHKTMGLVVIRKTNRFF